MENFHLVLSVSNYPPQSNNFFLKSIYFFDITSLLYWNLLRFLISFIRLIPLFLSLTASLFATTSCKNVETLQRKTAFFGFKSLLVTLLCNIILASLLLSIQSCSSSFECGLLLLATSTRGGGGGWQKYKAIHSYSKIWYSASSTFATGCITRVVCIIPHYVAPCSLLPQNQTSEYSTDTKTALE